jgi:ATP-dependent Lhr-like helicase
MVSKPFRAPDRYPGKSLACHCKGKSCADNSADR